MDYFSWQNRCMTICWEKYRVDDVPGHILQFVIQKVNVTNTLEKLHMKKCEDILLKLTLYHTFFKAKIDRVCFFFLFC